MSLTTDTTTALEAMIRAAIPAIPAGAAGVSLSSRLPQSLGDENLPHLVFGSEGEKAVLLRHRQRRTTCALVVWIIRRGATHAALLADWDAIYAGFAADTTLGGVLEASLLELEAIVEPSDGDSNALVRMTFSGVKVF